MMEISDVVVLRSSSIWVLRNVNKGMRVRFEWRRCRAALLTARSSFSCFAGMS